MTARAKNGVRSWALGGAAVVLVLVGLCSAMAWVDDSPVAARAGGEIAGNERWAYAFLFAAAAAVFAYAASLWAARRHAPALVAVGVTAFAIQLAPLAAPLLLSTDAWTYWDYGRIATVHDGNPYRDPPAEFPADPAFRYVGADWRDTTSVYGPAFTLASEPAARAAGTSADAAAWIYKTLAAAAVLAAAFLAARLSPHRSFALAFVGWNPVLALHLAGGGHNDAWMAALVLAALAAAAATRPRLAGAAWALAVLVKWLPLALLALVLAGARSARRCVSLVALGAGVAAVAALASWRYGTAWLDAVRPLARNAATQTSYAVPHRLEQLGLPHGVALALVGVAAAAAFAWLLVEGRRGRVRLGLAACVLLLATPYLAPWYLVWAVPLAAAEDDRTAQWLALALTAYLVPQTIPV